MNGEQNHKNLIDTTDCLEAVGVCRGWKNILFFIILCILLLLQVSFWLVHSRIVTSKSCEPETYLVLEQQADETLEKQVLPSFVKDTNTVSDTDKQVVSEPNQLTTCESQEKKSSQIQSRTKLLNITTDHLSWLIRFLNFFLILTAILYCLTMLFILKMSLQGRMGGMNHITRAFFLSLLMLVLLLPWQKFFNGVVVGAMFTPSELLNACENIKAGEALSKLLFYIRFCVYWFAVVLLLIFSGVRSARWAKATLRRLDVV
ncbi:MAG: hypothetical protein ACYTEE_08975 [Planctomycetota bacterium]|jgi:hypothetical protein